MISHDLITVSPNHQNNQLVTCDATSPPRRRLCHHNDSSGPHIQAMNDARTQLGGFG